jgi:AcrR family transcriptional regulator
MAIPLHYDARMLRSRAALRDAFLKLVDERELDSISVRDITRTAGVGSATFYRHYQMKSDLLNDVAEQEMTALIGASAPALHETGSSAAAIALCRYVEEHKALWKALLNGGAAGAMRIAFQNYFRAGPPLVGSGNFKSPDDLRLIVGANGLIATLSWWLRDGQHYSAEAIAEFLNELVIAPNSAVVASHSSSIADPGSIASPRKQRMSARSKL